jgi:hypothetical protein
MSICSQGVGGRFESYAHLLIYIASADGAVPGLLNQVMGVRISPEAPIMDL